MSRRHYVLIAALWVSSAAAAGAQTLPPPAARQASSEASEATPTNGQHLSLNVSAQGAFDDNIVGQGSGVSSVQQSGSYSGLLAGGNYAKRFRFFKLGVTEQSTLRYYPTLAAATTTAQHSLGGGFGFQARGTLLQFNQSLAYRPFFAIGRSLILFSPEPGEVSPGATFNEAINARTAVSTTSSVSGSQALGRSTAINGSASYDHTTFTEDSTASTSRMLSASLSQKVTRNLSLVAGYGNQQGIYRDANGKDLLMQVHNIDAGVNYSRPLGRTRRTTIGFTTGSTIGKDAFDQSQFRLIGSARLNREIGRSWHATGAYNRGVNFIAGFQEPFFADTFAVDVAGSASQRIALTFNGGYSKGEMGFSTTATANKSLTSTARIRIGLSHTTGFSAEYEFYQYMFENGAALPLGVPANLHRQGLRFGFDLFLPVIR